jgi:hypothetical protein
MPLEFKKAATATDAPTMSDTVVEGDASNQFLLDGDPPRLGESQPVLPNLPPAAPFSDVDGGATMPVVSAVLTDGAAPALPTLPAPAVETSQPAAAPAPGEPRHPMAHLMPEKLQPSEASIRAAEMRAAKKAKARKVKIGVAIVAVVFAAVVGPPVARWTIDAINEAGSTKPDEPEPSVTPAADTEIEPTTETESRATPQAGLSAIEDAKQLTGDTTPTPTVP